MPARMLLSVVGCVWMGGCSLEVGIVLSEDCFLEVVCVWPGGCLLQVFFFTSGSIALQCFTYDIPGNLYLTTCSPATPPYLLLNGKIISHTRIQ